MEVIKAKTSYRSENPSKFKVLAIANKVETKKVQGPTRWRYFSGLLISTLFAKVVNSTATPSSALSFTATRHECGPLHGSVFGG